MAFRRSFDLDMEKVAAFLKDAVAKVESDPEALEELKKVFKKNVPLTRRSYVAAYLLKQCSGSIMRFSTRARFENVREDFRNRTEERRNRFENRAEHAAGAEHTEEPRERTPRVQIDPAVATSVFVSIGRNRRVFPRDLVGLFCSVAQIDRERIGDIKVLANYSFVQVYSEDAEKIINALNGYDFRGRKLAVNLSRQKDEAEENASVESPVEEERVPGNVENTSAPIADSFTTTNNDTVAEQAAFAKAQAEQAEMTDEEILAARAPRSSSSEDLN